MVSEMVRNLNNKRENLQNKFEENVRRHECGSANWIEYLFKLKIEGIKRSSISATIKMGIWNLRIMLVVKKWRKLLSKWYKIGEVKLGRNGKKFMITRKFGEYIIECKRISGRGSYIWILNKITKIRIKRIPTNRRDRWGIERWV